ncbi:hypothetical protein DFQ26_008142 [Actinomortierella ambigua]|nr:hypothetical protein DFQ26_008142 [Actinomortierella ambigua]
MKLFLLISAAVAVALVHGKPEGANHGSPAAPHRSPKTSGDLLLYNTPVAHKPIAHKPIAHKPVAHKNPPAHGSKNVVQHPISHKNPPAHGSKNAVQHPISHKNPPTHRSKMEEAGRQPVSRKTPHPPAHGSKNAVRKTPAHGSKNAVHKPPVSGKPKGPKSHGVATTPHQQPPKKGRRLGPRDDYEDEEDERYVSTDDTMYRLSIFNSAKRVKKDIPVESQVKRSHPPEAHPPAAKGPKKATPPPKSSRGHHPNPAPMPGSKQVAPHKATPPAKGHPQKHTPPKASPGHHPKLHPGAKDVVEVADKKKVNNGNAPPKASTPPRHSPAKGRRQHETPSANRPKTPPKASPANGHRHPNVKPGAKHIDVAEKKKSPPAATTPAKGRRVHKAPPAAPITHRGVRPNKPIAKAPPAKGRSSKKQPAHPKAGHPTPPRRPVQGTKGQLDKKNVVLGQIVEDSNRPVGNSKPPGKGKGGAGGRNNKAKPVHKRADGSDAENEYDFGEERMMEDDGGDDMMMDDDEDTEESCIEKKLFEAEMFVYGNMEGDSLRAVQTQ